MNRAFLYCLIIAGGVGMGIISAVVQYRINSLERRIRTLKSEIASADTDMKVLGAEISRLSTLPRIKRLAAERLEGFRPIARGDEIRVLEIPISPRFER
ncbi:MAG: hypothetical protein LBL52_02195 [Rickettsiales bacterium]|jgi:cell division protein FtsL|nr:hypothetical protein [Rickettsiales bacterium]